MTLEQLSPYPGTRYLLFMEWVKANPDAIAEMEEHALDLSKRGLRVSAKYLIEYQRYEGEARMNAIPYIDEDGAEKHYSFNNTDSPYLARYLSTLHPDMDIELRRSKADGVVTW